MRHKERRHATKTGDCAAVIDLRILCYYAVKAMGNKAHLDLYPERIARIVVNAIEDTERYFV